MRVSGSVIYAIVYSIFEYLNILYMKGPKPTG